MAAGGNSGIYCYMKKNWTWHIVTGWRFCTTFKPRLPERRQSYQTIRLKKGLDKMAWTDKPTETQINSWHHMVRWLITNEISRAATKWLAENTTRRQLSDELGRLRELRIKRALNDRETIFQGELWDGFDCERYLK